MRTIGEPFTKAEDDFIRTNRSSMSDRELASRLGRSIRAVESRARKLDVRRFPMRQFTPEEDAIIRSGFGGSSTDIARQLGRAPSVIRTRAVRLGLGKWKRGHKDFRGYKIVKLKGARRIPEHRDVVERVLGRTLTDSEVVHHIDFNKRNNGIGNLHPCADVSAHSRAHHSLYKLVAVLLERRTIYFDSAEGIYKLCEIRK